MSETQIRNTARFIKAQVGGKGLHVKKTTASNGQGDTGQPSIAEAPTTRLRHMGRKKHIGRRKMKFVDTPLTDFDLSQWCQQLGIPLKGAFSRN